MPNAKQQMKTTLLTTVHQWMTIIGFPFVLYMVTDIYTTFKKDHDTVIEHSGTIANHTRMIDDLRSQAARFENREAIIDDKLRNITQKR